MWNERYARPGYLFGKEPAQFLLANSDFLTAGKTALAVADGEGRNSVFMAQKGVDVTAFDYSDVALSKAKALAVNNQVKIKFMQSDLDNWNWEAPRYDLVVAIFIQFVAQDEQAKLFRNLQKAIKPKGLLLLHGYTPKQVEFGTGGPGNPNNLYTKKMLEHSFENMEFLRLESYEKEIHEGQGHSGMSALIDFVGRKK